MLLRLFALSLLATVVSASHRENNEEQSQHKHHHRRHHHSNLHRGLAAVPVVLWHGMGDSCCNPLSMGSIKNLIEEKVEGVYVHSLELGENMASDIERGFLANMNDLVKLACDQIAADPALAQGYNAIGFSQGGLFLRAVAQRCPSPPMKNLVSVGGPQQGVFGLPYCTGPTAVCNTIRRLLELGAYASYVQNNVVQAQYWHDSNDDATYRAKSIFLADINNEKEKPNPSYRTNLLKLKNLALVKFAGDHMVVPKDSEWFGYYADGDLKTILPFNETRLYKEDLIGLKKLYESGRLHFIEVPGEHLRIDGETFTREVIDKYLK